MLARRAAELPPPIQMCDALSRNLPAELKTIVANCLAHGRRQFVEVAERFSRGVPARAGVALGGLPQRRDRPPAESIAGGTPALPSSRKRAGHGGTPRLACPAVRRAARGAEFERWARRSRTCCGTGTKLTLFLREAGAPLDNNICERALKKAILHRKNALFYKTCRGAHVGDVFMSLIHTCELGGVNPFDYLTELERHAGELSANPQNWMPWNYRETLAAATTPAPTR